MRKAVKIILILSGALLLINAAILFVTTNFNLGILVEAGLGAVIFCYGIFLDKLKGKKIIHAVVCTGLAVITGFCTFLYAYGNIDNVDYTEKTVIVLGCGLSGDRVSNTLAKRLDEAVYYQEKNPDAVIIVSGGQGPQEEVSEAFAMKNYLLEKGIDESRIIMEDKSTSTITNLAFSHEIMKEKKLPDDSVVVVSNSYHLYRAVSYAKAEGLKATHLGADIRLSGFVSSYLREILAVAKMWVFD